MKCLLLFVSVFLFMVEASGQATAPQAQRQNNGLKYGFGYFGHYKFSQKWGVHTDVQFRMDEKLAFAFQNVYRVGLIRYLNPRFFTIGGYALLTTHSELFEDYYQEHRIFEQLSYSHKRHSWFMFFRFRAEQRFVEKLKFSLNQEAVTYHYMYGNRFRFMNRTAWDLTKNPEATNVFFFALQDEIFLNIGAPEINRNYLDQNRFLVVFGVANSQNTKLETGYANIFIHPYKSESRFVHSLHFAVIHNLDFSRPKKSVKEQNK